MIFVFSTEVDNSTDEVLRYLIINNIQFCRFDLAELFLDGKWSINIQNNGFEIRIENYYLTNENIKNFVFWHRRESSIKNSIKKRISINKENKDIFNMLLEEYSNLRNAFYALLREGKWLSYPIQINKLEILHQAAFSGLRIPNSLSTNSKDILESFFYDNLGLGRIICKPIGDYFSLNLNDHIYLVSPQIIDCINKLPKKFSPSLSQIYIEKEFDVRIFYIKDKLFPSAIFSQTHENTKIDFRINPGNNSKLRTNAIVLPDNITTKICNLMHRIKLDTGSIDMVYSKGDFYFLEVNPEGQFGEYANVSGYNVYEIIAKELIDIKNG